VSTSLASPPNCIRVADLVCNDLRGLVQPQRPTAEISCPVDHSIASGIRRGAESVSSALLTSLCPSNKDSISSAIKEAAAMLVNRALLVKAMVGRSAESGLPAGFARWR
jgi:hypothetical protein